MAVVRSGQAITVLTHTAVPPDLQILSAATGLPKLPSVGITLRTEQHNTSRLLRSFEAHVRAVLPTL
jgi:DNA-binding transcriptional LysR family regulator